MKTDRSINGWVSCFIMKRKKNVVRRLNNALSNIGSGANPSLVNLLLHGPIDKRLISDDNLAVLEKAESGIQSFYDANILPKIGGGACGYD